MAIKVNSDVVISNSKEFTGSALTVGNVVYTNTLGSTGQVLTVKAGGTTEFADAVPALEAGNAGAGIDITVTAGAPTISVDLASSGNGLIFTSPDAQLDVRIATKDKLGTVSIGDGIDVDINGEISVDIPDAPVQAVEGGQAITVTGPDVDGKVTINADIASDATLGVVKIGEGLDIQSDGTLSAELLSVDGGDGIDVITNNGVSTVSVDLGNNDAGLYIDNSSKELDINKASDTQFGTVKIGDGLSIAPDGTLEADLKDIDSIDFKGEVDLTSDGTGSEDTDSLPAGGSAGDAYVNIGEGAFAGSIWDTNVTIDGNTETLIKNPPTGDVQAGDLVIYDGAQYVYVATGGSVVTYAAGHGLSLDSSVEPQVFSVDEALIKVTYVSDTAPLDTATHTVTEGDLWWNSADGTLYIYYTDTNSSQWVVASPQAPQITDYNDLINTPTIGDGTITIKDSDGNNVGDFTVNQSGDTEITLPAPPDVSAVTISDTAPSNPSPEDLWWNSSDGMMYIYYQDVDSSQWVVASPSSSTTRVDALENAMSELYQDAVNATNLESLRMAIVNALSDFS